MFELHTGFYSDKAAILIQLIHKFVMRDERWRKDILNDNIVKLLETSHLFITNDIDGELCIDSAGVSGEVWRSVLSNPYCFGVHCDRFGEVCININEEFFPYHISSSMDDEAKRSLALLDLYESIKKKLPIFINFLKNHYPHDYETRVYCIRYDLCYFINGAFSVPTINVTSKEAEFTVKDMKIFLDAVWRLNQTLEYSKKQWKPHTGIAFKVKEYRDILGKPDTNPFTIAARDAEKQNISEVLQVYIEKSKTAFDDYFKRRHSLEEDLKKEVIKSDERFVEYSMQNQ